MTDPSEVPDGTATGPMFAPWRRWRADRRHAGRPRGYPGTLIDPPEPAPPSGGGRHRSPARSHGSVRKLIHAMFTAGGHQ